MLNNSRRKQKDERTQSTSPIAVSLHIKDNLAMLQSILKQSVDIVYYDFMAGNGQCFLIAYLDDMVDKEMLDRDIIGALSQADSARYTSADHLKAVIHISDIYESTDLNAAVDMMLAGEVILFTENLRLALCLPIQEWNQRSIKEPDSEVVTKGPKEGFVETLQTNRSMIRRKLHNPGLCFEPLTLGAQTNTAINLVYLEDVVNQQILAELKRRLEKIDIDAVLEAEYIQELIRDHPLSPFQTIGYTERPDVVVAKILEGRIAVLCSGTPVAITVPYLFLESMQSNEDYYTSFFASSINRAIRYISFILTVFVPGAYVALVTNHHEIIPSKLLFSLIAARSGVPFPTIVEVLVMILIFEMLRESGLRLPKGLGQTVSIVGALVLGQAAVEARFISAPVVIVIAITAITSFMFYPMNGTIMICRLYITLLGGLFGLYGLTLGLISITIHMFSLRSFGIVYMGYIGSLKGQEAKDTIIRAPWWYMHIRPRSISKRNNIREGRVRR